MKAAGLSWPLAPDVDEGELERRLFAPSPPCNRPIERPLPNWAMVHQDLSRKGVTLRLTTQRQGLQLSLGADGVLIGEFGEERRHFTPIERIPPVIIVFARQILREIR